MKKLLQIVLVSSLSLLCFSCYYDNETIEIPDVSDEVFFSNDIQPILTTCIGCHNGTTDPDLREGNSYDALVDEYVNPGNADGSLLVQILENPTQHPNYMLYYIPEIEPEQALGVRTWIEEGADNN